MDRTELPLEIKAIDAEMRRITGIATTRGPDRVGDIVEPLGISFENPIPLLWHHERTQPVGTALLGAPTPDGVPFTADLPTVTEAGLLKDRVDEAWHSIQAGLIRAVSIGYRALREAVEPLTDGGLHIKACAIHELSLVTVPANTRAVILTTTRAKALDAAAMGRSLPGVTGASPRPPMTPIADQIKEFETTRAAHVAAMSALMQRSADRGETLDPAESQQYDHLADEVKSLDAHLPRLRALEQTAALGATPIAGATPDQATATRGALPVIRVRSPLAPGTAFTRYAMAIGACGGNKHEAAEFARQRWHDSSPEVELALKAAVAAGNTTDATWAGPLAVLQPMASEFLELLRPATLIGKIPNFRKVPFNVSVPSQTAGGTYQWVGQGAPKPVGKLDFATVTLGIAKAAGIIVTTEELLRVSTPSAEATVRADMVAGMASYLNTQFIDPTLAAVANVSPGSVTNGTTPITTAGTTPDNARTDLKALVASFVAANLTTANAVFVMSESNAFALAAALNPLGQPTYPSLATGGGSIFGIPVVTSQSAATTVALIDAQGILMADEGGVNIDVSREASVQMDSAPDNPALATTVYVSLWQTNTVGFRAERFINWKRARLASVKYVVATYL